MNEKQFTALPVKKVFFRLTIPSVLSMIFSSVYMMADGIFVGRFIGEHALAAVNLVMPIMMILLALSNMIAVGSSVKVSTALGENTMTVSALLLFAPSYLFTWFNMVTSAFLTAMDKPKESMLIMAFRAVVFPLLCLFILPQFIGVYGVFLTATIAGALSFVVALVIWIKSAKQLKLLPEE